MKCPKKLNMWLFVYLNFYSIQNLQAQNYTNMWFRNTFSVSLSKKIKIDNEIQHRRQNGFENQNMFDKNLMFTFRNWIHYQLNPQIKLSISPFAYFSHYKIIEKKSDETLIPNQEIRFSLATDFQHKLLKKFYFTSRTALEYRAFTKNQPDITRWRNRVGIRYDANKEIRLSFYDELFLNLSKINLPYFFDHNRIGLNIEYFISSNIKAELGYIYLIRLPLNNTETLQENNIFLNLGYQIYKK